MAAALLAGGATGYGVQVLKNSSLEASTSLPEPSWTAFGVSWVNYALLTAPATAHTGNNSFKVYGQFTGGDNWSGLYQDVPTGPGAAFTGDAWANSDAGDGGGIHGGDEIWAEVIFFDAANNRVGLYRSTIVSSNNIAQFGGYNAWFDLAVTNVYDPNTYALVGTTNQLVAPANTATVRFQVIFHQTADNANGSAYFDDFTLNQVAGPMPPSVLAISPDGSKQLFSKPSSNLTFTAASGTTAITNIQLVLNGNDVSAQLSISGSSTNKNVTFAGLQANQVYSGTIRVTDALGFYNTATVGFDTFDAANFVWEAEDFDFTGGLFIDNPVPSSTQKANSYYGRVGWNGYDENETGGGGAGDGPQVYRPGDGMSTDFAGDVARQKFLDVIAAGDTNAADYAIGYFGTGEWVNYTHAYPAGKYNVYARLASGNATGQVRLDQVTGGWGTSSQTTTTLGNFTMTGHGWTAYDFVPLKDSFGNLVILNLSGGTNTLRATCVSGANMNFFMLVPAQAAAPSITDVFPDGTRPFQPTNTLVFKASSPSATINNSGIQVTLNGVDVSPRLIISGSTSSKNVTLPGLAWNAIYTAVLKVTDANSNSAPVVTLNFDTFSETNMMFEAEDWDFGGGQFFQNPVLSSYATTGSYFQITPASIIGVDVDNLGNTDGNHDYRFVTSGIATEKTSDYLRQKYVTAQATDAGVADYDVGWWHTSSWINYTRVYPTNNYFVYARLAGGGGAYNLQMSQVVSGAGTSNQVVKALGTCTAYGRGWQAWDWVPVVGTDGRYAVVPLAGTNTLRATTGSGLNAGFYMVVPAPNRPLLTVTKSGANAVVSFPTQPVFTYTVVYKQNLSDASWQWLSTVQGDGTVKSVTDPVAGSSRFYRVLAQ